MKLTKEQKAAYACFMANGNVCYFDWCEYKPYGKYRFYDSHEDKVYYLSKKKMAQWYDTMCEESGSDIMTDGMKDDNFKGSDPEEYLKYLEKTYNGRGRIR